jgi:ATP-binding cassette, subfamily B, beta-glucan exporter
MQQVLADNLASVKQSNRILHPTQVGSHNRRMLRIYVRALSALGPYKRLGWLLAFANVGLAATQFAEPILFGRIIDALASTKGEYGVDAKNLAPFVGAWVAFGLFNIATSVTVAWHADRLAHRQRLAVIADFFDHALSLPLAFHSTSHSGKLLEVMITGSDAMSALWLGFFREHCAALVSLFVLLPLTLFLSWQLGVLLVILVVVFSALTTVVVSRTQSKQERVRHYHSAVAEHTADTLSNIAVVQSFTRVEAEMARLRHLSRTLLDAQIPVLSWWAVAATLARAAATLTITAILLLGAWLFSRGEAGVGDIVSFVSLASMLIARLEATIGFVSSLFFQAPRIAAWFDIRDTRPSVADAKHAIEAPRLDGDVAFEEVTFSYDGARQALSHVSFHAAPGETIALVGATGSGKSTTLSLLHRAFDPGSGRITIDGRDARDYRLVSLRRQIAVVFQEPMLFARSLRENLLVGKPDATEAEMLSALERAQALEIVERDAYGLDLVIGERGRSLSGGERQRLSIARALLKDPPILVLDEATAALDATTEQAVKKALDEVMKNRTTFVIAHRLATVKDATRILVFDKGKIIESGTFDELVALKGRFAALATAQFMTGPT